MYSYNELHGKSGFEKQEMMIQKGVNFDDYPAFFRRGTFIQRVKEIRHLTEDELVNIPTKYHPTGPVERMTIKKADMPEFRTVINRVEVIFHGEKLL